jgi:hypothetical protein
MRLRLTLTLTIKVDDSNGVQIADVLTRVADKMRKIDTPTIGSKEPVLNSKGKIVGKYQFELGWETSNQLEGH